MAIIDVFDYLCEVVPSGEEPKFDAAKLNALGAPSSWLNTKGAGVKIAVIDTGNSDHDDLAGAYLRRLTTFPDDYGNDTVGHGTHVAGIIAGRNESKMLGMAPKAKLIGIRAVPGTWKSLTIAMEMAISEKADVINFSCGTTTPPPGTFLERVKLADRLGIIMVAAVGNSRIAGQNTICYPARLEQVIPVAAIDKYLKDAPFSATGSELERGYAMFGVSVLSTWLKNQYAIVSGTSMAAPYVTSLIAHILAKHRLNQGSTPIPISGSKLAAVRQHLDFASQSLGDPLKFGHGFIDVSKLS